MTLIVPDAAEKKLLQLVNASLTQRYDQIGTNGEKLKLERETVLAMQVGRELDSLVIQYIFPEFSEDRDIGLARGEHQYSKNILFAWDVVEKLHAHKWIMFLKHTCDREGKRIFNDYSCTFLELNTGASKTVVVDSAPEAICKAALLVVMEDE